MPNKRFAKGVVAHFHRGFRHFFGFFQDRKYRVDSYRRFGRAFFLTAKKKELLKQEIQSILIFAAFCSNLFASFCGEESE